MVLRCRRSTPTAFDARADERGTMREPLQGTRPLLLLLSTPSNQIEPSFRYDPELEVNVVDVDGVSFPVVLTPDGAATVKTMRKGSGED